MELTAKKEMMKAYAIKLEKEIKKEKAVLKEIEDDKASLNHVHSQKQSGASLEDSAYESYDEWVENLEKEIRAGENRIKTIEFKKVLIEAVQAYVA